MIKRTFNLIVKIFDDGSGKDNIITLPFEVFRLVREDFKPILKVGKLEKEIKCILNNTSDTIEISNELVEYFGLIKDRMVNLIIKEDKICLGPVVGIFVSNGQVRKGNSQNPSFRWIETMNANKEVGAIIYYFSIKDVDFAQKKVIGTYFNEESDMWEKRSFPYPDVLYDRGGGTLKSQQMISEYIRKDLTKGNKLIKLNPRYFFDKWEVYEKLSMYKEVASYMPKTILYTKAEDVIKMLELSSTLYIKDCLGNNGIGVARLRKLSDKEYELSHFFKKLYKFNLDSTEEALEKIDEIFKDKKVIIQSAIDLLQIDGRNIDMRATVQRDGTGKLSVNAFPVRIGKEECPITSTRSGSSVYTIDNFLKKFYNYSEKDITITKEKISEFLISFFRCIEDVYGEFGELGIDFAIDKQWRVWFIECNAKPGKDTVYLSYDNDTIKRVFLNPLEYAKYLWRTLV